VELKIKLIIKSTAIATAAKPVRSPGTTKPPIRPIVVAKCIKRGI
jgi:hypothetical protein